MTFILLAAAILAVLLLATYWCYRMAFFADRSVPMEEYPVPQGEIYEPYHEQMKSWIREIREMPHENVEITSFDGLKLCARYYEYAPDAPIELLFHGYRGTADQDMSGGVLRCFLVGHSALLIDQRACGMSEGNKITFGINESRDCHSWISYVCQRFGEKRKLILCGMSMGASTVLMAAGRPLPPNVVGVLADCGYTTPKEIICKVIRQLKLPPKLCYPFVRLGARLFAGFDLEEDSSLAAMSRCKVPVIFFHGEDDDFVPCDMSRRNYEACNAPKRLVTVPGAGHGLSYFLQSERYLQEVRDFFREV